MQKANIISLLLIVSFSSNADVFKSTDNDGSTYYGDNPPNSLKAYKSKITKKRVRSELHSKITYVDVKKAVANGINKYVLHANTKIDRGWANGLSLSDNSIWVAFENSIIKFDITNEVSMEYAPYGLANHLKLSTHYFQVLNSQLIFLGQAANYPLSSLHVYNTNNDTYKELPLNTKLYNLIHYDDRFDDGLFLDQNNTLIQGALTSDHNKLIRLKELKYTKDSGNNSINELSTNQDAIWYAYSSYNECSIGFYNKNNGVLSSFSKEDIGLSYKARCGRVVADEKEAWVSSRKGDSITYSIYNIKNATWKHLTEAKNKITLNGGEFEMHGDYIYYTNCGKLIALNKRSKVASKFIIDQFEESPLHHYCITSFKIYKNNAWILKIESYKSKPVPVLYKVPLGLINKFNQG